VPLRKGLFTGEDAASFARKKGAPPGDLDITPMIDVTFLLLIFFMVSSTMQSAPPLDLPPADHSTGVTVSSSIVVTVKAPRGAESSSVVLLGDGKGPEATPSELRTFLEEQQKGGLSRVVIKAEGDVPHGVVTEVARTVKSVEGLEMYLGVGDHPKR
jgi:biopolymer transport protein ExbD